MKGFGRILLSLAVAGVLQTALAASTIEASRACVASAANSPDDSADCSHSGSGNSPSRPLFDPAVPQGKPPKSKDFTASVGGRPQPMPQADQTPPGFSAIRFPDAPVYLITRRLRI